MECVSEKRVYEKCVNHKMVCERGGDVSEETVCEKEECPVSKVGLLHLVFC